MYFSRRRCGLGGGPTPWSGRPREHVNVNHVATDNHEACAVLKKLRLIPKPLSNSKWSKAHDFTASTVPRVCMYLTLAKPRLSRSKYRAATYFPLRIVDLSILRLSPFSLPPSPSSSHKGVREEVETSASTLSA